MGEMGGDSGRKLSAVMAMAAARHQISSWSSSHRRQTRRRSAVFPSCAARKRPRTSWGKPHSSLSNLRSCNFSVKREDVKLQEVKEEEGDDDSVSPLLTVPALDHHFLVKKEPANEPLYPHQVPTFFPIEQFLTFTTLSSSPPLSQWRCDPFSSSSPISPVSPFSSSPHCSSGADEFSSDDIIGFASRQTQDACDVADSFLGERFYEIERDMRSIMGDAVEEICAAPSVATAATSVSCQLLVPKSEPDCHDSENLSGSDFSTGITSNDTSTTAMTLDPATSEDEYRIDLTDFEPDKDDNTDSDCDQKPRNGPTLCLRLNYDEVIREWSDRGSPWADGSWARVMGDECELDLKAWEGDRNSSRNVEVGTIYEVMVKVEEEQSAVDEFSNGDHGGANCAATNNGGGAGRHARVMRYREKRRTRLFSKKIRYEVRKLNAERRPRMKGRFIKRINVD